MRPLWPVRPLRPLGRCGAGGAALAAVAAPAELTASGLPVDPPQVRRGSVPGARPGRVVMGIREVTRRSTRPSDRAASRWMASPGRGGLPGVPGRGADSSAGRGDATAPPGAASSAATAAATRTTHRGRRGRRGRLVIAGLEAGSGAPIIRPGFAQSVAGGRGRAAARPGTRCPAARGTAGRPAMDHSGGSSCPAASAPAKRSPRSARGPGSCGSSSGPAGGPARQARPRRSARRRAGRPPAGPSTARRASGCASSGCSRAGPGHRGDLSTTPSDTRSGTALPDRPRDAARPRPASRRTCSRAAIGTKTWMPRLPVTFGNPMTPRCSKARRKSRARTSVSSHVVRSPGSMSTSA